jgi:Peptidase M15
MLLPDRHADLDSAWIAAFTATQHRAPEILAAQKAIPDAARVYALTWRTRIWEPLLGLWGPTNLNSGYRCPALNALVGGAPKSVHQEGRAGDCRPLRHDLVKAMTLLAMSSIHFGKAILEFGCIHVELPAAGLMPARSCLVSAGDKNRDGSWICRPFDPRDPDLAQYA